MGKNNTDSGEYLFRKVSFCKKKDETEYVLRGGPPISYTRAREILIKNLASIGLNTRNFGLHSFRSGGATSARSLNLGR
jgi:hypothetical protein